MKRPEYLSFDKGARWATWEKALLCDEVVEKVLKSLHKQLLDIKQPTTAIKIIARGDGLLGIVQRQGHEMDEIIFAGGETLGETLANINKAISGDRWKEDLPWDGD